MNTLFKYMAMAAAAAGVCTALTACQDDVDDPAVNVPVAQNQANITIYELKKTFWSDDNNYIYGMENKPDAAPVAIPAREDGSHYIISGRVISSDEQSNVFKSLVIQDETAALAFSINSYNLYLNYRIGQEIVVDITGMYIGKYNGLLQVGQPEWYVNDKVWEASFMSTRFFVDHRELNGMPDRAAIDTLVVNSIGDLPSGPEGLMRYQSQMVRFNNVAFANGGKETFSTYHSSGVNQSITDAEGQSLNVRTSGYSTFWNNTLPEGRGDVVGILSYYGTGWQLILNDLAGCMNFGNPTIAPGAETNPWTVDQAVAIESASQTRAGWVTGYIVGAVAPEVTEVKTNDDVEWTANPILDNTLVIGQSADTKDIAHALVVELPYGSKLRELGNLAKNPGNYGKQIWIRGTLDKVMGTFGVADNNGGTSSWRIDGLSTGGSAIADGDGTKESPYSAAQVMAGKTGTAWVKGYIVGSSNGKSASDFTVGADNASASNIFIANTPDETDYSKCVPVQLPSGPVRTALNLQSNPGNVGKIVSVDGSLEKYFGQPGVKTVTDYVLEGGVTPPTPSIEGSGTEADPYTVGSVLSINPQSTTETTYKGVWVKGYIVGWADMSTEYVINANTARFATPATLATNILVAAGANVKDVSQCIGVQLPAGTVRNGLNLVDNPGNLGKAVMLQGDILKYSGVPGVRNTAAFKLDGQGGEDPDPVTPVTSIDQNFDAGTSIPAGWTQMQIAGSKNWYIATFNSNNYAAMTGYKGTAPFDSWLMTPPVEIGKCADKTLTFDTQVNGYGSTTSVFEVYVLDNADPAKATVKTKLNASLATAPASGYSSWQESGKLDLSAYTGTIYIGFRYYATQDANYATWCLDNVKLNAGGQGGEDPDNPPTPSGDFKGDFNTFNGGEPKSSPYGTYTNATGWTAENSIVLSGSDGEDANPYFRFIGARGTLAPTLNGNTGKVGKLLSPVLTGGIGTLTFKYGYAFSDTKGAFRVTVKDEAGNVLKTEDVTVAKVTTKTAYDYKMTVNHSGSFTIEILNLSPSNASSNKDRVSIWNLTWTTE